MAIVLESTVDVVFCCFILDVSVFACILIPLIFIVSKLLLAVCNRYINASPDVVIVNLARFVISLVLDCDFDFINLVSVVAEINGVIL